MNNYSYDLNKAIIESPRTMFGDPFKYTTTFNAGDLVPVLLKEVLPGDSFKDKLSAVCRELTLLNPVMDNSYLQFDFFFVPYRIIWDNTKQFFGENETGTWTQTNDYLMPSDYLDLKESTNSLASCRIGDYLNLPVGNFDGGNPDEKFNYLPLRAYAECWNKYYMAESAQSYVLYSKGNNNEFDERLEKGYNSPCLKVNRYADVYTTALPSPQKGPNVPFLADYFPVVPKGELVNYNDLAPGVSTGKYDKLFWGIVDDTDKNFYQHVPGADFEIIGVNGGEQTPLGATNTISGENGSISEPSIIPANLYASTVGSAIKDINNLRVSIATQHYYEVLSRIGSKYNEGIYGLFGIKVPDLMIDNPQYLGSIKQLINVNQVASTAELTDSPIGSTGAYSLTSIANRKAVNASFFEYGYILGLAHVRTDNSYSQGVPKLFSKKSKFDIYNPLFANIGNVAIKNKEIYFGKSVEDDNAVFGYAEAWYDYKKTPNTLTGYMRPNVDNAFSSWTYGRVFADTPTLSSEFLTQTDEEINRTIAVDSSISNQFKLDILHDITWSRIMPLYSIPGLKRI